MAGDGSDDGRLRAGDLYNLNLRADLVTLSACETALGKITQGDDVVGFTRGFLYAGAGSIISTLWRVDDQATKDLMLEFYSKLATMDKCEALRYAQLQTRKKYSHPFYSGFLSSSRAMPDSGYQRGNWGGTTTQQRKLAFQ